MVVNEQDKVVSVLCVAFEALQAVQPEAYPERVGSAENKKAPSELCSKGAFVWLQLSN